MFQVETTSVKFFNPINFAPIDRVVYHILHNFINPTPGHFTFPGKVPLVYYYMFEKQIPIDWGWVVHCLLADMIADTRCSIPHSQFLTPIFRHFSVPVNEFGISPHPFDMDIKNKKGILLHNGSWITRQAYQSMTQ